ncbi:oligosaccharide flippase family protein [Aerococcus viridans]
MKVIKDIFRVSASTIVGTGSSFLVNFMLPIVLSLQGYGQYQTYITYLGFTYLLNFGFNDGIYIKYGGKDIAEVNSMDIQSEHNFVIIFQTAIFLLSSIYAISQKNLILFFFFLVSFLDAISNYQGNLLKATGNFKDFTNGNFLKSIFYILLLVIAIFIFKITDFRIYIIINILSSFFLMLYFEEIFFKHTKYMKVLNIRDQIPIFKIGIIILISNASLTFVGNIGRIIANSAYPSEIFAQYAFQNSLLNLILILANAIGMVFFNIISKKDDTYLLNIIKKVSLYVGIIAGLGFFIIKAIILLAMPKYTDSLSILSITFISLPYIIVSKMLIANLYRAKVASKKYLVDSVIYAGLATIFVYTSYLLFPGLEAIALSTTICYIGWFLYTTFFKFNYLKNSFLEIFLLIFHSIIFYFLATNFSIITGFILYFIFLLVLFFVKKKEIMDILTFLKETN